MRPDDKPTDPATRIITYLIGVGLGIIWVAFCVWLVLKMFGKS